MTRRLATRAGQGQAGTVAELHFFFGTLCHLPLLERVLGRPVEAHAAHLPGHEARVALDARGEELSFPMLVPGRAGVPGLVAEIAPAEVPRLDFYEAGYHAGPVEVALAEGGRVTARSYLEGAAHWQPGSAWDLDVWRERWGETVTEAVAEYMALRGVLPLEAAIRRYPLILVRAASRLRARAPRPATLRRVPQPGDVEIEALERPYTKFFAVEDYTLRHRTFGGAMSAPLERAAFVSGDATVVLPYDPVRDRVLLVEQFRTGPLARGDANPWCLEPIAGRVDAGETPETAARREAQEEAGLTLSRLIAAPRFYPSVGAKSEYLFTYLGLADLPDGSARIGGIEAEGEDIRSHLISFDGLMSLIETGEAENAPLVVLALWLARLRPGLRAEAEGAPGTGEATSDGA